MKKWFSVLVCICSSLVLFGQRSTSAPLNDQNHYIYDRLEIKTGDFGGIHSMFKPLMRRDIRYYQDVQNIGISISVVKVIMITCVMIVMTKIQLSIAESLL